jgi:4-hydroxy-tetrahydrodipicolinate synthase
MLTPFNDEGGIDWTAYARYTEWQCARQPSALFAVCGSSEMKWLTRDERMRLIAETVKYADTLPVFATANLDPDPAKHADEMRQIEDLGASALVLVPPQHVAHDNARYFEYLSHLSQSVTCPILVYEWPQVDNHLMDAGLFSQLAKQRIINGIKDTTCTMDGIAAKQRNAGDVIVYQANTPYLIEALNVGVRGIMAVTSTARADLVKAFWDAYQASDESMITLHRELVFMDAILRFAYPATAKYLAGLQGLTMSTYTRWDVQLTLEMRKVLDVWHHNLETALPRLERKKQ